MYQRLMTFVIKIFHLQVNPFSGQTMRWSFWTQPEPKGQILNLGEHIEVQLIFESYGFELLGP